MTVYLLALLVRQIRLKRCFFVAMLVDRDVTKHGTVALAGGR